jgi:putative ABC transport system substrate-binding protein
MKRLLSTIAILVGILVVAFISDRQQAQDNQVPTVGILQFVSHPALDEINRGIQAALKDAGYHDGENINIDFQNAQGDQSNLKTIATRFDNANAQVSVGIATPAAQALANTVSGDVLFSAATDPIGSKLVDNMEQPGGQVTGVSDQAPLDQQLDLIQTILPDIKTLGIVYTSSDDSATTEAKKMQDLAQKAGLNVQTATIAQSNDLAQVAQSLVARHDIDAIFVPTDNTIASAMPVLLKSTDAAKVPVFPTAGEMVQDGGVAAQALDQYGLGYQSGEMLVRLLKGQKAADTPVEITTSVQLVINQAKARELGINIPAELLQTAKEEGELLP